MGDGAQWLPDALTFVVPGERLGTTRGGVVVPPVPLLPELGGQVKETVRLGERRGEQARVELEVVPGRDVLLLQVANGPTLVLHPETARDLLRAQSGAKRGARPASGTREAGTAAPAERIEVPVQLRWRGLESGAAATRGTTRGFLGDALLSTLQVVTGITVGQAADFTAAQAVKHIDAQVDPGVYRLNAEKLEPLKARGDKLAQVPAAPDGGPLLVLVHGTFVETTSTFGKLWTEHPQLVRQLFSGYGDRVYALDHPTLGASPIENALTLARALPPQARLHLVTHSRGGLVAEVLARVCARPALDEEDFEHFEGDGDGVTRQREALRQLAELVQDKGLRVDRVVRVACPARGTLLASKRLDAYVSVLRWLLERAGIPVLPELVRFLGAVAQRRADPDILPGLEAQTPNSALVKWLHASEEPLPGELRVVAGDMEGDSVVSWLKTLLADAFYWTDNDLVVQTRSMYGGAARAASATFLLDQGGGVSHFSYFRNPLTAQAIVAALTQAQPAAFRPIGPLSAAGEAASGTRGLRRGGDRPEVEPDKPAVFVLPGILGSNLAVDGKRIWLGWRVVNGLRRLSYDPAHQPDDVEPDGPVGLTYEKLMDFLGETHQVIEFSFDWRLPMEQEARRLGRALAAALDARAQTGQPVQMLAHSMGGLLARTLQLECQDVWERWMAQPASRLLMLGTPNGGSWAPMQVLSGDDTFGNTLVAFGAPFQDQQARRMMAQFPGFIQLQAGLLDPRLGLDQAQTWQKLADDDLALVEQHNWWHHDGVQLNAYRWGVPSQEVLDQAVALRRRLDQQRDGALDAYSGQVLLVVGRASFTPDGFELGNDGLAYLDAAQAGDGRVTLASALLPKVRTWFMECEHGNLPSRKEAFGAFLDLLTKGDTRALPVQPPTATRGGAVVVQHVRSRPAHGRSPTEPPMAPGELYGPRPAVAQGAAPAAALRIGVVNGDLTFVRPPLLLGHYRALRLMGTEGVVDRLIGGTMQAALSMGQYPDAPGACQVFTNVGIDRPNPLQSPRPEAVIVVGLGEEGKLGTHEIVATVRTGVIAWAQRLHEQREPAERRFELAATLIGSGGMGIAPGQAAQAIAQGVREANLALAQRQWPQVGELQLIELYLDRAAEAWRALQIQGTAAPGHYQVAPAIAFGRGPLRRPLDGDYRGADYDLITAVSDDTPAGEAQIRYSLDTRRARTEVRAQKAQGRLLRELVQKASNDRNQDPQLGRTLFQLLVPVEMEPFLGGNMPAVLDLNAGTAGIPWELLDTPAGTHPGGDLRPWALRTKLLRKLRTEDFRRQVVDAGTEAHVLVVGEPLCDKDHYPRLAGARTEATTVADCLSASVELGSARVRRLISPDDESLPGPDASVVINALMERDWRVVHIAGHGEPPLSVAEPRGVVLSNGIFLGPLEIRNMRVVPELVFVNCCHLAARDTGQLLQAEHAAPHDRARFAATVAGQLIDIGVRCVIAAGWAVEDEPAMVFASVFYERLLQGAYFIDAVAAAREAAYARGGNTWAAYQCYGDPNWTLRLQAADAQRPTPAPGEEFEGVASPVSLALALETLATRSLYQNAHRRTQQDKLRYLESRYAQAWGGMGAVAEAFGVAWDAAGDREAAAQWYQQALAAGDGSASMKAAEQLANLRVRAAWDTVRRAATGDALQEAAAAARQRIDEGIGVLRKLVDLQPTVERLNLLGSAYKRLAMIALLLDGSDAGALDDMATQYQAAEDLACQLKSPDWFYPAGNRIAALLARHAGEAGWSGLQATELQRVRDSLEAKAATDPDFWSIVGLTEWAVYEGLSTGRLADRQGIIESGWTDLQRRMPSPSNWGSVHDQMHFVLTPYRRRAAQAQEREAAQALLDLVRDFAGA